MTEEPTPAPPAESGTATSGVSGSVPRRSGSRKESAKRSASPEFEQLKAEFGLTDPLDLSAKFETAKTLPSAKVLKPEERAELIAIVLRRTPSGFHSPLPILKLLRTKANWDSASACLAVDAGRRAIVSDDRLEQPSNFLYSLLKIIDAKLVESDGARRIGQVLADLHRLVYEKFPNAEWPIPDPNTTPAWDAISRALSLHRSQEEQWPEPRPLFGFKTAPAFPRRAETPPKDAKAGSRPSRPKPSPAPGPEARPPESSGKTIVQISQELSQWRTKAKQLEEDLAREKRHHAMQLERQENLAGELASLQSALESLRVQLTAAEECRPRVAELSAELESCRRDLAAEKETNHALKRNEFERGRVAQRVESYAHLDRALSSLAGLSAGLDPDSKQFFDDVCEGLRSALKE